MACRKLESTQKGPFVYTLPQGSALEIVGHLEFEDYEVEDGEQILLNLLLKRWPAKNRRIFSASTWRRRSRSRDGKENPSRPGRAGRRRRFRSAVSKPTC
eukprot:4981750-Pyramimonas_sp.AAC.1